MSRCNTGERLSWIIAIAALLVHGNARGQTLGGLDLEWSAPEGCPNAADLRASIQQLLGPAPGPNANLNVSVSASASREESGHWLGTLETRSGPNTGKRVLRAESCQAVAGATALIVALMIDPDAVVAHQAANAQQQATESPSKLAAQPTTPSANPPSMGREQSNPLDVEAPRTQSQVQYLMGPAMALDLGNMPSLAFGVGGRVGLMLRGITFEMGLLDWLKSEASIPGVTPATGGTFRFLTLMLSACPSAAATKVDYGFCIDAEYDRMSAEGFGVNAPYRNSFQWLAIGGSALGRLHLGQRFGIPLRIGALVPLAHPIFRLNGISQEQGRVHRPADLVGRVMLGVDLIF
jgi:hypothetical protein